jgi:Zn-dependent protease with chaperone function
VTSEQWEALVRRLDGEARQNPGRYRLRVGLLAALGYLYILGALLVIAGAAAAVVFAIVESHTVVLGKLLIPLIALALIVFRALGVRIPPPEGIRLDRSTAPGLWRLVDDVRGRVNGPRVHQLLLDGNLNAGVVQIPRFGLIGPSRNYLTVGLPLMQALTPEEFTAVIAHEFGHLSNSHGRFGSFIYRIRATWGRLLEALEVNRHWGQFLFNRFFGWYAPYFSAYSFALVRAHEYEADQAASEAAGPRAAATALAALTVADRYLGDTYWPGVYSRSRTDPQPPATAFSGMAAGLAEARVGEERVGWLEKALRERADTADTHPSLSDRLTALGVVPPATIIGAQNGVPETAAQRFFGAGEPALAQQLDRQWCESVASYWAEDHDQHGQAQRRLAELEQKTKDELTPDELAESAYLTAQLREPDEAIPALQQLVGRDPDQAAAHYILGSLLLRRGDDAGLEHLDRAVTLAPDSTFAAVELAVGYLTERNRLEEADAYRRRALERADLLDAGRSERLRTNAGGRFEPHVLPPEEVERLREALSGFKKLKRAYLVRKPMKHLDEEFPLHVLFLIPGGLVYNQQKLVDQVAAGVPFDGWIFSPHWTSFRRRKLERIPGAKIYER